MAIAIAQTLEFLLGDWSIARSIEDQRNRGEVSFRGRAVVSANPEAGGAIYRESGEVSCGGHVGPAHRTLLLAPLPAGGVRFDFQDGRPFIDVNLGDGHARAVHPCRADTYEMDFSVLDPDTILERWRVSGPEKDYTASTTWRRR